MKYLQRDISIITGKKNLEHLYTIKNFPVFISYASDKNKKDDINADMSFSICRDSGIIQLDKVLPLEIVYQSEHSIGLGKVWKYHYKAFSQFIDTYKPKYVLEIGGGNGIVANLYTNINKKTVWTIVEPLPSCNETEKIKIINGWFDKNFQYELPIDTIIHSHVLEHIYNPREFITQIYTILPLGGKHIFSVPNLYKWLSNKYTNCLNFEHTIFLTEYFIDYLLMQSGFKILSKRYYADHSIFYAAEKVEDKSSITLQSKYSEYKELFNEFINYHKILIKNLNQRIGSLDYDIYLFGAHIFSQFLLQFGLDENRITGILDNALVKQGKRLYGTSLLIYSSNIIKGNKPIVVILKVATHQEEVKFQLFSLNKNVIILED